MRKTTLRHLRGRLAMSLLSRGSIRMKIQYLLQANRLYLIEDLKQKIVKNGEKLTKSTIELSVFTKWRKEKNEFGDVILVIQFQKTGSILDEQLLDLGGQLQALFKSKLERRSNQLDFVEYRLIYKQSKDYEVYDIYSPISYERNGYINLNRYHKWTISKPAHLLIAGKSGSGKSLLLNKIVHSLSKETQLENIYIADGKMSDLKRYAKAIKLPKIANNIDEIYDFVSEINDEMMKLYEADEASGDPVFLVIDEYIAITAYFEANKKKAKELTRMLTNILVLGRAVGYNVILASQRVSQDTFGSSVMRGQFGIKIQLGNATADDYKMIFDTQRKESELLERKAGEGYLSIDNGDVLLFERTLIDDESPLA